MSAPSAGINQPVTRLVPPLTGVSLPGGRERCFTKLNPELAFCKECPDWIKQQCGQYSAAPVAPVSQDKPPLDALSRALSGEADDDEVPF